MPVSIGDRWEPVKDQCVAQDILDVIPIGNGTEFPGAMPVGMRKASLRYITSGSHRDKYVATAKLDGLRVLVIQCAYGTFLVDRHRRVYKVGDMRSPIQVVMDGELMGTELVVAFDMLLLDTNLVYLQPYRSRLATLTGFLSSAILPTDLDVIPKRVFPLGEVGGLVGALSRGSRIPATCACAAPIGRAEFDADGIVFMDTTAPYSTAGPYAVVKWKRDPTVDVMVYAKDIPRGGGNVSGFAWDYCRRRMKCVQFPFLRCYVPARLAADTGPSGRICAECRHTGAEWVVERWRRDKRRANSTQTLRDTVWGAQEGITLEHLRDGLSSPSPRDWMEALWIDTACTLWLRITYHDQPDVPRDFFSSLVASLWDDDSLRSSVADVVDYVCGAARVTQDKGRLTSVIPEEIATVGGITHNGPLAAQCVLSVDHPHEPYSQQRVAKEYDYMKKCRRFRFIIPGPIAIDCTRVYTMAHGSPAEQSHFAVTLRFLECDRSSVVNPISTMVQAFEKYLSPHVRGACNC